MTGAADPGDPAAPRSGEVETRPGAARRARSVGPDAPADGRDAGRAAPRGMTPDPAAGPGPAGGPPPGIEWQVWSWSAGGAPGGRRFPFLGILLVLAAVALLVGQLLPGVGLGSLLLVALGGACAAAWLAGGRPGATVPALVLLAWGLAGVATESGLLGGIGWTPLAVGTAFLAAWALGGPQRRPRRWALPAGLVLVAVGLLQLARILPDGWALLWPVILLLAGLWLIRGARMRRG
ncbi:MAG: hypothetical protein ACKOTZ_01795 [Chloroflexota bacterium]